VWLDMGGYGQASHRRFVFPQVHSHCHSRFAFVGSTREKCTALNDIEKSKIKNMCTSTAVLVLMCAFGKYST
jgi:hypothetical protein